MKKTNFLKVALACIVTFFSLASCMEKIGDEMFDSQTFVRGDYILTPEVKIKEIEKIIIDTIYVNGDPIIMRDTLWKEIIKVDSIYIDNSFSGVRRGKCYVIGKGKAAVQRYTFDKGDIINQEMLYGSFDFLLTAGKTEVENKATLNSTTPEMSGNTFSFDVTDGVGGASVNNTWSYEYNAIAQFDGFTETIDAELSIESADFYQRSDLEWRHMVTAYLDGIPQATATWEFWKEEKVVTPDPVYTLEVVHKEATLSGDSIIDTHVAELHNEGEKVESHEYNALWSVNYSKKLALPRETAEAVANTTVSLNNGSCELGSYEFFANLNLSKVESVSMQENGTTYCHPAFAAEDAVIALDCCNLSATNVVIGSINDDVLPAEIVVVGHEEIRVPFTINVTDKPEVVRDTTYSQAVPVSASQAKVVRTITANGTQESSKDILVNYSATLECGEKEMISNMSLLDYGKAVAAKDGANTVAMNIHSFNATVEIPSTLTFSDEGKQITVDFNYTNLAIESNGAITRTDNSTDAYDLINNSAYFKLVLNGFTVATDNKEIEQKKDHLWGWEWDKKPEFSSDMRTVYLTGYRTKNNIRTGFSFQCSANLEYTFTPGAALEFNSNETPSIKDANAVIIGNEAFIPHTLGSTEFNATFTYGGTTRVTFSYSDEYVSDEVTVDLNISYDVKATGAIEQSGTSYSTPAALYANGVEVKKEKFVFSVIPVQPTYTGYRVYNAGQWAITRIYDQNATTSLVVLVGALEHIQTGEIYAIHQVLEGSSGNLPENFQKVSTPTFGEPYSMYYNVAASAWEYGSIVGAKKGTTNTSWMYFNWNRTDNQIVSSNTSTDLLDDVVLYQLGSEDNIAEAGTISLTYNGQTITVVSDK